MKRTPLWISMVAAAAVTLAGCGGDEDPLSGGSGGDGASGSGEVTVGSANFPENVLLAEIYAGALEAQGLDVSTTLNIGAREAYVGGLQDGSIDVMPEYTGNLRLYFDESATGTTSDEVYAELEAALPEDLVVLEPSAAEDKDAVVVTQATADKYDLTTIGDLEPVAGDLTLGGPPEWKTRSTGVPGLRDLYGLEFGDFRELDAGGPLTLKALLNGQIDAGNLFTTDPNIAEEGLVVLEDPEALFAAQNVVPLLRADVVSDEVETALNGVSAALDTETLGELVRRVVLDNEDADAVAQDFLTDNNLN